MHKMAKRKNSTKKEKDFDPYLIDDSEFDRFDKMLQSLLNSAKEQTDLQPEE